jgi:outer membrane protein TolC
MKQPLQNGVTACLSLVLVAGSLTAAAAGFRNYPDLPPLESAAAALRSSPEALAARAGIKAGEAARRRLQAGDYEYNLRLTGQRRTVTASDRFREWDVGLERTLRLPGKAAIDGKLGETEVVRAQAAYGDALHEGGRSLLRLWFSWRRESAQVRQWQDQVDVLKQQLEIVNKRVRAGDAPRLESALAEAAVAQAQSALHQARLREQIAANELSQRFPTIPLPASVPLTEPVPLEQGLDYWREEILRHNHELAVARSETAQGRLLAERGRANKTPDPTLGLRYAGERDNDERILGLTVSIPFPGEARTARAEETAAHSEMAAQREAAVLRKVSTEAANTFAAAEAAYNGWKAARTAAEKIGANADLLSRAYSLGETNLTDVLIARRQALEARLAAALAQLDASESQYRLLLDAHQLWPLEEEDGEHMHY